MRYYLSSFGLGNPFIVSELPDHAVYPLGTAVDDAIDLDYSPLLLGNGFLIDSQAYNYVLDSCGRLPFLKPMAYSLSQLHNEGLLETTDVQKMTSENNNSIVEKTEALCNDFASWLGAVRYQWGVLKQDRDEFVKKFGTQEKRYLNEVHFTVANAVIKLYGSFDRTKINAISSLITSKRLRFSASERNRITEVLKPLVAHTIMQDLIRYKTGALVLDWDDSAPFYSNLYKARWDKDANEETLLFGARNLLDVQLPELRPKNIDSVIKFVRDNKNVSSLRADILASLQSGEKIDSRWTAKYLAQVIRANLAKEKTMRKIRFGGAALGLLIPGASLATEAAIEASKFGGEEVLEHLMSNKRHWLFALLGDVNKL